MYLQVLELNFLFLAISNLDFKYLKVHECYLQVVVYFFPTLNIYVMNILV
jgi:hypothetical protein